MTEGADRRDVKRICFGRTNPHVHTQTQTQTHTHTHTHTYSRAPCAVTRGWTRRSLVSTPDPKLLMRVHVNANIIVRLLTYYSAAI